MKKKERPKIAKYITLDEVTHILRVSPDQMDEWLRLGVVKALPSSKGLVLKESEFKHLAHSTITLNAALHAFKYETRRRHNDEETGKAAKFLKDIKSSIGILRNQTDTLEAIHKAYHDKFDLLRDESGIAAAYLIFSKVFRLFRMALLCTEYQYWDTLLLIRPINEALDLATYFVVERDSQQGKQHIREWFREDRSPSHSVCRGAIEKYATTFLPANLQALFQGLMGQLYHATSKPIHVGHHDILEVYVAKVEDGTLKGLGFDYGPCSYPRKIHGIAAYLRSLLLAAVNLFTLCFQTAYPLIADRDATTLQALQLQLLQPSDIDVFDE
jgi:hypothetical protein